MSEQMHDAAAERAVLTGCIYSTLAVAEAAKHLTPADFWEPAHEVIYAAILQLRAAGRETDAVSVMALVGTNRQARELLPEIVTGLGAPGLVGQHAEIVRSWATKRRIVTVARKALDGALRADQNPVGYAASLATEFATIRDAGATDEIGARTLGDLLADPDDQPDWLIPGLLERKDRLIVSGSEGLGKSHLLRQFAICAAAGVHPWTNVPIKPIRALIVDCENSERQVKAKARGIAEYANYFGSEPVGDRVFVACLKRMDITSDRSLAEIHRMIDRTEPDLVVIGPLYRLSPRAIQSDDEAAPLLAALDTIRDRDVALLIEAHAGHAVGAKGAREMRPRGSSALIGWPEFGYGMRDLGLKGKTHCAFVAWRGDRSEREWPSALKRDEQGVRWLPYEGSLAGVEEAAAGW